MRGYDFLDYKFNLIKSPEDPRDFVYSWLVKSQVLPSKLSRDNECSPIRDQGKFGVCYSFAGEGMKEWQEWKEHPKEKPILSPLFLAQECKKIDGFPNTEGSTIKAVVDVLHKVGICYESTYPFENYKEALKFPTVPSRAYGEALNFKIKNYAKCYTLEDIKLAIVNSGLILAGVMVTDSFLTPENGFINMPLGRILGGHAICCVGFDDNLIYTYKNGVTKKGFLRIRNSWNTSWGDKGYAWLPYDFYYGKIVDLGSPYFFEAWSTVDLTEVLPDEQVNSSEKEEIILWIGKNEALLDGVKTTLLQSPILLKGSTLLPIRFVAENMGYSVEWVGSEKKVILRKK